MSVTPSVVFASGNAVSVVARISCLRFSTWTAIRLATCKNSGPDRSRSKEVLRIRLFTFHQRVVYVFALGLDAFDRFGIDFPDDAELDIKVVLVASCFLIDYLYFEGDEDDDD